MSDPKQTLKEIYGYDSFRPGQEPLIRAVLSGRDAMGIMPTGAGKSICFQIPALCMDGLTLVISPLISLMLDQVLALKEYGIRAAFMNSTLTPGQQRTVLSRAAEGAYQIMYVAPERLSSPSFVTFCQNYTIPFVAVDEAHCISQWGHAFRPDYLNIKPFIDALPVRPVVGAYTATATVKVREDIVRSLGLRDPLVHVNSFDRPNLRFDVSRGPKKDELRRFLHRHPNDSGIIYCSTRKEVENLCNDLIRQGIEATRYHAGLSDEERTKNQNDFLYDRSRIMVATNAFGMGIDKSNVSWVVHYNMPKNLESYYQEAGRAGRDGSPADCLLLYSGADVRTNEFLIENSLNENEGLTEAERAERMAHEKELLKQMTFYATTPDCLRMRILRYFGEESQPCGNCGNCDGAYETVDIGADLRTMLSAVMGLEINDRPYGRMVLRDFLKGSRSRTILDKGLDALYGYGELSHLSADRIMDIIDWAVLNGWLVKTDSEYPVIKAAKVDPAWWNAEDQTILARLPKERKDLPKARSAKPTAGGLFEELRKLRRKIADEQHVPAYVIFSDATLADMARLRPTTYKQFLAVKGVGQIKARQYGAQFLECIRIYEER